MQAVCQFLHIFQSSEQIDGTNLILTPGFIDCHVHVLGGGGEGGFANRTPEATMEGLPNLA